MNHRIYIKAAKLIVEKKVKFACYAIDEVEECEDSKHRYYFEKYFMPPDELSSTQWFSSEVEKLSSHYRTTEGRERRMIALLLMAEIAKEME